MTEVTLLVGAMFSMTPWKFAFGQRSDRIRAQPIEIGVKGIVHEPLSQAWPDPLKTYRIVTPFPSGSSFTIESPARIMLIITSQQSATLWVESGCTII